MRLIYILLVILALASASVRAEEANILETFSVNKTPPKSVANKSSAKSISHSGEEAYHIQVDNEITLIYRNPNGSLEKYDKIPVLPNGKITLPRVGEISAQGLSHVEFINAVKANLQDATQVDAIIHRVSNNVTVIGSVIKPGSFPAYDIRTIYDAIGKAGGFNQEADKRHVKLVRQRIDGSREEQYINFPKQVFKAYEQGIGEEIYLLQEGDLIFVPPSRLKQVGLFTLKLAQVATIGVISGVVSVILD